MASFDAAQVEPAPRIVETALPVGLATMEKLYEGGVSGRSTTLFTSAYDAGSGVGAYVALESFEGTLNGVSGTFNFAHAATTSGSDRSHEYFLIVPSSGTGGLESIRGSGGLSVDGAGTHDIWFEYELD